VLSQWFLVGAGRCGLQLARAMTAAGIEVVGVEARSPAARARARRACPGIRLVRPDAALPPARGLVVAVPDSALAGCASALAPRIHPATKVALHTSGLAPAGVLSPLARATLRIGSFHPLVAFPSATGPVVDLSGVAAAVEGEPAAVRSACALARALGMRPFVIAAEAKARYHAAAALAANLPHALVAVAHAMLVGTGLPRAIAARALARLAGGAVASAAAARGMERLTGPIARGDAHAVRAHLDALPERAAAAYRAVGLLALEALAAQKLLKESQIHTLERALTPST